MFYFSLSMLTGSENKEKVIIALAEKGNNRYLIKVSRRKLNE